MLITFIRQGFANNSSSSHSIIFSPTLKADSDDENLDNYDTFFGWEFFTCSSKSAKAKYLFATLSSNFAYEDRKFFPQWCKRNFADLIEKYHISFDEDMSIDHQSRILLPLDYGIQHQYPSQNFFRALVDELVEKPYFILGGNDNSDREHPLTDYHQRDKDDILQFLNLLTDNHADDLTALQDVSTAEWVLSDKSAGGIFKVVFESDYTQYKEMTMESVLEADDEVHPYHAYDHKTNSPYLVDISISNYCSIGCPFCYQSSTTDGQHADADYLINTILPALYEAQVFEIVFGGGEPTQHPYFLKIVKAAFELGFKIGVTSKNFEYWIVAPKITKYIHSLAFSCQTEENITTASEIQKKLEDVYYDECAQIYVQLILELHSTDKLIQLCEAVCKTDITNITLLGYKNYGFGQNVTPKKITAEWIDIIKSYSSKQWIRFGIDSVLVKKYRSELIHRGVENNYLVGTDGKQTCYIDAVEQTVSASSFSTQQQYKFNPRSFLSTFSKF